MLRGNIGRTILAVLAGYVANALLVAATEQLLQRLLRGTNYYIADLVTQCVYEVAAGYLCAVIARETSRGTALAGLIFLGLVVGTISLITAWKAEPNWYGVALLAVWAPCLWIGFLLKRRPQAPRYL